MKIKKLALLTIVLSIIIFPSSAYAQTPPKILFGIGTEAGDAIKYPIVTQAPVKMLSSWFNSTDDLQWMVNMKNDVVPQSYAKGYALHLITHFDGPEGNVSTQFGNSCGRAYPLSAQFLKDIQQLATIFKGNGPFYVTLFTEFQDYTCTNNQWKGNENYYQALKSQYRQAVKIFHQTNPNARISIGWGGWQTRYDDPANGGGKSMIPYFKDIMSESDFQSFQSMESDKNTEDIKNMTSALHPYGPVMLAHYKPDNRSQSTFDADVRAVFTDAYMQDITNRGLFSISFMDNTNMDASSDTFNFLKSAVQKYSASWIVPPALAATKPAASTPSATPKPTVKVTPTVKPKTPSPTPKKTVSPSPKASVKATAIATPIITPKPSSIATTTPHPTAPVVISQPTRPVSDFFQRLMSYFKTIFAIRH